MTTETKEIAEMTQINLQHVTRISLNSIAKVKRGSKEEKND
jgi:hypothetical protein